MDDRANEVDLDELDGEQLRGGCFCGKVTYAFSAHHVVRTAYCHCTQCQRLTGECCPFIHTIHLPSTAVSLSIPSSGTAAQPSELAASAIDIKSPPGALRAYSTAVKPHKTRLRCSTCGTCVASINSRTGTTSVWGVHLARLPAGQIYHWDKVQPTAHIFYGTHLLAINDGLGKWSGYEHSSDRLDE
ncbi:Mss4-like protein [Rhodofomes roseus]|uniref:Mss4-like protein n=1 Tax=Rhodofomes roseus TaxID=34475 RepID=A0ABQ8JZW9_9APHY|nr:Mss4-like protein [Rhodofomes roseus]KAH9829918.1 Mss4-like protein [Rhodofomes roseus]